MAYKSDRQARINPNLDEPSRIDPVEPDITINQTSAPYLAASTSSRGYIIAAIVVVLGIALAIYFGSRPDTATAPVTQDNTTTVPDAPAPPVTQNTTTAAPEATAPATPPETATQPPPPDAPAAQPPATTTTTP